MAILFYLRRLIGDYILKSLECAFSDWHAMSIVKENRKTLQFGLRLHSQSMFLYNHGISVGSDEKHSRWPSTPWFRNIQKLMFKFELQPRRRWTCHLRPKHWQRHRRTFTKTPSYIVLLLMSLQLTAYFHSFRRSLDFGGVPCLNVSFRYFCWAHPKEEKSLHLVVKHVKFGMLWNLEGVFFQMNLVGRRDFVEMVELQRCLSAPILLDGFCRADLGLVLNKSDLPLGKKSLRQRNGGNIFKHHETPYANML